MLPGSTCASPNAAKRKAQCAWDNFTVVHKNGLQVSRKIKYQM